MKSDMEEQFLKAYNAHADVLFRHCYFRVYNRELAKDLVQETFFRTWTYLTKGKEIKNIRAFLYKILHNVIVDHIRKKKSLSLDQLTEEGFSLKDKSSPDLEQRIVAKEIVQKLECLDEPYRSAVQLKIIDELSIEEISDILGVSRNTASVRIHRGINKLRKLIKKEGNLGF